MQDVGRVVGHHPGVALTEKRARFVALIRQGVSNSEACRLVGVNRKTGTRWRYGRTIRNTAGEPVHYPAVTIKPASPRSSRYLSLDERTVIADLRRERCGVREIARRIGRAASTVSRELRGNADEGRYRPHTAQAKAQARMPRPRQRRVATDPVLGGAVCELLTKKWSPEQVAHELTVRFAGQPDWQLCPESIYQAIYDPDTALTRPAKSSLRSRRRRRRLRTQGLRRRGRLPQMRMIAQRPSHVEGRQQAGHWEGDCATRSRTNMSGLTDGEAADDEAVGAVTGPCPYDPSLPLTCDAGNGVVRSSGESPRTSVPSGSYRQGEDRTGEVT